MMIQSAGENNIDTVRYHKVCNMTYLTQLMGGKKHLIRGIMDAFLKQIPEELQCMNDAILRTDYAVIKSFAHTMKSSVSIVGVSSLIPVLQEMEDLGVRAVNIEKLTILNAQLRLICSQAIDEIEKDKLNYI